MLLESLPKSLTRVPVERGRAEHLAHVTCPLYCEVRQEFFGLYIFHAPSDSNIHLDAKKHFWSHQSTV